MQIPKPRFAILLVFGACAGTANPPRHAHAPEREAVVAVQSVSPGAGTALDERSVLRAKVAYRVDPMVEDEYFLVPQLVTRGAMTWGPPRVVKVTAPSGTVELTVPMAELLKEPMLATPVRLQFVLVAGVEDDVGRLVAESGFTEFPLAKGRVPANHELAVHLPAEKLAAERGRGWPELPAIPLARREFAISLWVKVVGAGQTYGLLQQVDRREQDRLLHLELRGGLRPYFGFYGNDVIGWRPARRGEWTHLLFQYRAGHQEIWMDRILVGRRKAAPYAGRASRILLGRHGPWATAAEDLRGELRDLRIYQRALSEDEMWAADLEERPRSDTSTRSAPATTLDFTDDEPRPHYSLRVQAVRTANDDGSEETVITPEEVSRWIAKTNWILANARSGIRLLFDPRPDGPDWGPLIKDTGLNHIAGDDRPTVDRANRLAGSRYRGKLVVFFRYAGGYSAPGRGNGFSGGDLQFIAMPAYGQNWVTSNVNEDGEITKEERKGPAPLQFAHELGHYLGLPHTFATTELTTAVRAARYIAEKGWSGLDYDRFADTPPDLGMEFFDGQAMLHCDGDQFAAYVARRPDGSFFRFNLSSSRYNVMSYFNCEPAGFSAEQVQVMRQNLEGPGRWQLYLKNGLIGTEIAKEGTIGAAAGVVGPARRGARAAARH